MLRKAFHRVHDQLNSQSDCRGSPLNRSQGQTYVTQRKPSDYDIERLGYNRELCMYWVPK